MSSNTTDAADRRFRERQVEAALAADRAGRDRLIRQADEQPPEDGRLSNTPNTAGRS
jgi:hypothetical protein